MGGVGQSACGQSGMIGEDPGVCGQSGMVGGGPGD